MMSPLRLLQTVRATAHSACGRIAYRLGMAAAARRRFERVLLLRGSDFAAYVHLGRIAFDQGDYTGWRREFEHARRADPIRFARLHHPMELFEPRLAGTRFDSDRRSSMQDLRNASGHSDGGHLDGSLPGGSQRTDGGEHDNFDGTDARATWQSLRSLGGPATGSSGGNPSDNFDRDGNLDRDSNLNRDPDRSGVDESGSKGGGSGRRDQHRDGRHDGFGHGTDVPLAPGFDPLFPGDPADSHFDGLAAGGGGGPDDSSERLSSPGSNHGSPGDEPSRADHERFDATPDASFTRDDFASAAERRSFQLRRPIDGKEIARCNLDELLRRLSS